jgi:hypothetical protein
MQQQHWQSSQGQASGPLTLPSSPPYLGSLDPALSVIFAIFDANTQRHYSTSTPLVLRHAKLPMICVISRES